MMITNCNPLVSFIVVTYNSSKYVLETLESAKAQTYRNIELILSDDGSTDNTVELCRSWINENQGYFVRTELITVDKNTGIPANCNRGVKSAHGEWVKLVAGDDYVSNDYLEKCLCSTDMDESIGVIYTNSYIIDENSQIVKAADYSKYRAGYVFDDLFHLKFFPKGPSILIKRSVLENVNYYDEAIWVEDYLLLLNIAQKYKFYHLDYFLAYYRIHSHNNGGASERLYESRLDTIKKFGSYQGYKKMRNAILLDIFEYKSSRNGFASILFLVRNPHLVTSRRGFKSFLRSIKYLMHT